MCKEPDDIPVAPDVKRNLVDIEPADEGLRPGKREPAELLLPPSLRQTPGIAFGYRLEQQDVDASGAGPLHDVGTEPFKKLLKAHDHVDRPEKLRRPVIAHFRSPPMDEPFEK